MNENNFDPNDESHTHVFDVYSEKWGNEYYEMRPGIGFSMFGPDEFKDLMITSDHDSIVSIPMYCKMTGLSLSEIEYESIRFKIHWYYNHLDYIRDIWRPDWQQAFDVFSSVAPSEDLTFDNPSLV